MNIDQVLAGLDKKTRERALAASDVHIEWLKTPLPSLNRALGGGLAFGRQYLFWGNKSSGKSSLSLQLIAEAQRLGKSCLWMDVEKTFDPKWARQLGVDTDKLIVEQVSDSERVVNDVAEFMKKGIDLVVVDSISSIVPMSYYEKDSTDLKGMAASRQIGSNSRDISEAVKIWNGANDGDTLLLLISQERNSLGSMYVTTTSTSGKAVRFFSTGIIKLWSSESLNKARMGQVQHGDYIVQEPIGREVTFTIEANKLGKPFRQGSYDFYFDGDFIGVDSIGNTVDLAVSLGVIKQKGAWYYYTDPNAGDAELKFQGRDNLINHFRSLPADYDILVKEVENVT